MTLCGISSGNSPSTGTWCASFFLAPAPAAAPAPASHSDPLLPATRHSHCAPKVLPSLAAWHAYLLFPIPAFEFV